MPRYIVTATIDLEDSYAVQATDAIEAIEMASQYVEESWGFGLAASAEFEVVEVGTEEGPSE